MQLKNLIPSLLTCLNLLCGCIAVVLAFHNNLVWAAYFVFAAGVFDLFDGLAARALQAYSEFGKQLDSLADMVSFGLVPGVVMFKIFQWPFNGLLEGGGVLATLLMYYPFLITVFSALRLAKFNIDARQTESFIGLNTPTNTILVVSLPLIIQSGPAAFSDIILNPYTLIVLIALQSWLLVAEIPMFSFKMKSLKWKGNEVRYIFLASSILLLVFFLFAAIPLIIFFYVLLSFLISKRKTT